MTQFLRQAIPDVIELTPPKYGDHRGFFSEVYKRSAFEAEHIRIDWMQDNQSLSQTVGTVRGLHFQAPPHAMNLLIDSLLTVSPNRMAPGPVIWRLLSVLAGGLFAGREL